MNRPVEEIDAPLIRAIRPRRDRILCVELLGLHGTAKERRSHLGFVGGALHTLRHRIHSVKIIKTWAAEFDIWTRELPGEILTSLKVVSGAGIAELRIYRIKGSVRTFLRLSLD